MSLVLSIVGALLFAASFPKVSLWWLSFFSFLLFLQAIIQARSAKVRALCGFAFGAVSNVLTLYWIVYTLSTYGGMSKPIAVTVFVLLVAYLSAYWAAGAVLVGWLYSPGDKFPGPLVPASAFVVLEFVRGNSFTGFPWVNAGYALSSSQVLVQMAEVGGVYILSFFIYLVSTLLLELLHSLKRGAYRRAVNLSLYLGLLAAVAIAFGTVQRAHYERVSDRSHKKTFVVVQGNIDQAHKWDPAYRQLTLEKYKRLSLAALSPDTFMIVWPETATPFFFRHSLLWSRKVKDFVAEVSRPLFFGTPDYERALGRYVYFNTAIVLSPEGEIVDMYRKVHLVPFGEFIPLYEYLKFLEKLFPAAGTFSSGVRVRPMRWQDLSFGVLICYEAVFPELSRILAREGAQILFNITNDAWFGKTSAPYQHFNIFKVRAVEVRRPLLRAANTGISGAVDVTAEVIEATDIFVDASVKVSLPSDIKVTTLYVKWGDWVPIACAWIVAVAVLKRSRKESSKV